MSRVKLNQVETTESAKEKGEVLDENSLEALIPRYAKNKGVLDSYKKLCDADNTKIKQIMEQSDMSVAVAGEYTAKRTTSVRETLNEDKLIDVLKKHNIASGVVKMREYVDMDALESYMYNNEIPVELASDLNSCKNITEVVTLRISKTKKKEADE